MPTEDQAHLLEEKYQPDVSLPYLRFQVGIPVTRFSPILNQAVRVWKLLGWGVDQKQAWKMAGVKKEEAQEAQEARKAREVKPNANL